MSNAVQSKKARHEPSPKEKARRALPLLELYADQNDRDDHLEDIMVDLFTDLLHLASKEELVYAGPIHRMAWYTYEEDLKQAANLAEKLWPGKSEN